LGVTSSFVAGGEPKTLAEFRDHEGVIERARDIHASEKVGVIVEQPRSVDPDASRRGYIRTRCAPFAGIHPRRSFGNAA
jgi:hypothetical protein